MGEPQYRDSLEKHSHELAKRLRHDEQTFGCCLLERHKLNNTGLEKEDTRKSRAGLQFSHSNSATQQCRNRPNRFSLCIFQIRHQVLREDRLQGTEENTARTNSNLLIFGSLPFDGTKTKKSLRPHVPSVSASVDSDSYTAQRERERSRTERKVKLPPFEKSATFHTLIGLTKS